MSFQKNQYLHYSNKCLQIGSRNYDSLHAKTDASIGTNDAYSFFIGTNLSSFDDKMNCSVLRCRRKTRYIPILSEGFPELNIFKNNPSSHYSNYLKKRNLSKNKNSLDSLKNNFKEDNYLQLKRTSLMRQIDISPITKFSRKVLKGEQTRWIFSRRSTNQLAYIKEIERIEIEKQIKILCQLWDPQNIGTMDNRDIAKSLITIGLGGSPDFTSDVIIFRKQIVSNAFGKDGESIKITGKDLRFMFINDKKIGGMLLKIDTLTNEFKERYEVIKFKYNDTNHRDVVTNDNTKQTKRILEKRVSERNRRNAIIYFPYKYRNMNIFNYCDEFQRKNIWSIDRIISNITSEDYICKLRNEIKTIKGSIIKNQIESDIIKYEDKWNSTSDMDKYEKVKYMRNIKSDGDYLKHKYGKHAYQLIKYLIFRRIEK